jgi:hypothetical protein
MSLLLLFRSTNLGRRRGKSLPRSALRRSYVPCLDVLEDRSVPSTFTVTNLLDSGAGSLRQAILDANATAGAGLVNFAPGVTGTIALTSGELDITDDLTIVGPGAVSLTVSGNNASRVFNVAAGTTDAISGLTISNGKPDHLDSGAGILNAGNLTVSNCSISNNYLPGDPASGAAGGGIASFGILTVSNSTISGNTAGGEMGGGGIYNAGSLTVTGSTLSGNSGLDGGGILDFNGTATIVDSTFSANSAADMGGGIDALGGPTSVVNCTVSGNKAGYAGGGLGSGLVDQVSNQAAFNLLDTIVAGNTAATKKQGPDLACILESSGYNLIGNPLGGSGFVATDLLKVNPKLGPLQNNGGPTQTMALLIGSAAIDAGDPNAAGLPAYDQRGPGYARVAAGRVDIGAFEVQNTATLFALSVPSKIVAGVPFSVTVTALDAFGRVAIGYAGTVVFASSDPIATPPAAYTFAAADQGVHTFSGLVLPKKGKVTLSVADNLDASIVVSLDVQVS